MNGARFTALPVFVIAAAVLALAGCRAGAPGGGTAVAQAAATGTPAPVASPEPVAPPQPEPAAPAPEAADAPTPAQPAAAQPLPAPPAAAPPAPQTAAVTPAEPPRAQPAAPAPPRVEQPAPPDDSATRAGTDAPAPAAPQAAVHAPAAPQTTAPAPAEPSPRRAEPLPPAPELPADVQPVLAPERTGPAGLSLRLISPAPSAQYRSEIRVEGELWYRERSPVELRLPLSWELSDGRTGTAVSGPDGTFQLSVPTRGLAGQVTLTIRASDSFENAVEETRRIVANTVGPDIRVDLSEPAAQFTDVVTITGRIVDPEGKNDEVQALQVVLPGGDRRAIELGAGGEFTVSYEPPADLPAVELRLEASDYNRNVTRRSVLVTRARPEAPERPAVATATSPADAATAAEAAAAAAVAPHIVIRSPAEGDFYRGTVSAEGNVADAEDAPGSVEGVSALYYTVRGGEERRTLVFFRDDGSFAIDIATGGASGPLVIDFIAVGVGGLEQVERVTLRDGRRPPEISLSSPGPGEYGSGVILRGSIVDPYEEFAGYGGIEQVEYEVIADRAGGGASRELRGTLELAPDGTFETGIRAKELSGNCRVTVRVTAKNGNTASSSVTLRKGESDIPSFAVAAGDGSVAASWSDVAFAAGYSVRAAQQSGDEVVIETTSTAARIDGLQNGRRYTVSLAADTASAGYPSISRSYEVVPMAEETLGVMAIGEFEQIRLVWRAIPGAETFRVSRSLGGRSFTEVATVSGTAYTDLDVSYGSTYYYRVRPDAEVTRDGAPVSAAPLALPQVRSEVAATLDSGFRHNIVVEGGYVVAANGASGITLIDISNPETPTVVSELATNDARDVAVVGDYIFVADGDRGLRAVNIYNPTAPEIVGFRNTTNAVGIAAFGDYAWIADDDAGVKLIDVSNPRSPLRVTSVDGFHAADIAISGDLAVACGRDGATVIDISNPGQPRVTGTVAIDGAVAVEIDGEHAYVAAGEAGLAVVDLSDPAAPAIVSRITDLHAGSVRVEGDFVYIAAPDAGLVIYDVSNPATPVPFDTVAAESARDVVVSGAYAFLVGEHTVEVIRTHLFGTSYPVASVATGGLPYAVAVDGGMAYVAAHAGGLKLIDVASPATLSDASLLAGLPLPYAQAVAAGDGFGVVADRSGEVLLIRPVVDLGAATGWSLQLLARYNAGGSVTALALSGGDLYVGGPEIGLRILAIGDLVPAARDPAPAGPAELPVPEELPAPAELAALRRYSPRDIAVVGDRLYLVERSGDLVILDVSEPAAPVELAGYRGEAQIRSLAFDGELGILATSRGVEVVRAEGAGSLLRLAVIAARFVEDMLIREDLAYLADGYRGIRVFNLRNPAEPRQASTQPEVYGVGLALAGTHLLVVDTHELIALEVVVPSWAQR